MMNYFTNELSKEFALQIQQMVFNGEYDLALDMIEDFIKNEAFPTKESKWFFITNKTYVLSGAGRLDECLQYAELEFKNFPMDQFHIPLLREAYCIILNNIGSCLFKKGKLKEALKKFNSVQKIARRYNHKNELALSLSNSANILIKQNPTYAISMLKEAEKNSNELDDAQLKAAIQGILGECYLEIKNYEYAEFYLIQELKIGREIGSPKEIKHATSHLYRLYNEMNMPEISERFIKESKDHVAMNFSFDRLWLSEMNLQPIRLKLYERYDDGLIKSYYYETSKAIKEAIKEKNKYFVATFSVYFAEALYHLAQLYDSSTNNERAKREIKKAIRIFREEGYKKNLANALNFLGSMERRIKNYTYCLTPLNEATEIYKELCDYNMLSNAYTELGLVEKSMGNFNEAISNFEKAITEYEKNYTKIGRLDLKTSFFGKDRQSPYQNLLTLYLNDHLNINAWITLQKIRGRSLLILLSSSHVELTEDDFEYKETFHHYLNFKKLEKSQNILWEKWKKEEVINNCNSESNVTLSKYSQNEKKRLNLFEKLKMESKFDFIYSQTPIYYKEVKLLLNETNAALLEYFVTENKTYLFIIKPENNEPIVKEISVSLNFLIELKNELYENIAKVNPSDTNMFESEIRDFYKLGEILIEPALEYIKNKELLYIVPHHVLHYLPFHAMKINIDTNNKVHLIESFSIAYLSATSVLKYCYNKNPYRQGKRNISNPLVLGTWAVEDTERHRISIQAELKELSRLFQVKSFENLNASKDGFIKQSPHSDLIHIACHGYFVHSIDAMDSSGILLNNGKKLSNKPNKSNFLESLQEESFLSAKDILNLKLNCHIVTLSACETGQNDNKPGDELIGLSRALLYAGTPSVFLALWPVNVNSKSRLINLFYTYWKSNMEQGKAKALQKAQIELIKDEKYSSLYHWGAYFLTGDWL